VEGSKPKTGSSEGANLPRLRLYYHTLEQVTGGEESFKQHVTALDLLLQAVLPILIIWTRILIQIFFPTWIRLVMDIVRYP